MYGKGERQVGAAGKRTVPDAVWWAGVVRAGFAGRSCRLGLWAVALAAPLVLVLWATVFAVTPAWAQRSRLMQVEVEPTTLTTDDVAQVKVVVQARHVYLKVPETQDFELVSTTDMFNQPVFCMNMGYNVISGPCVYTFELRPLKEGEFKLPSFTLVGDEMTRSPGKPVDASQAVDISVTKGTGQPKAKKQARSNSRAGQRGKPRVIQPNAQEMQEAESLKVPSASDAAMTLAEVQQLERFEKYDVFLIPKFEKQSIFINEPFRVDYYIYIAETAQVSQLQDLQLPDMEGFRKEELEVKRLEPKAERVGSREYQKYLLARYVLIPLKSGPSMIKSAEATLLVNSTQVQQIGTGFSIQIQSGSKPMSVAGPSVQVAVQEVPPGAPAGFHTGNVGVFQLRSTEAPASQPAGSWNMLKFDIEGVGNLYSVVPPELPKLPDMETREAHVDRSSVKVTSTGIQGKVSVQIPFRMTRAGTWTLPALELVYLDPVTGSYGKAALAAATVVATAAEGSDKVVSGPAGNGLIGILREGGTEGRSSWPVPAGVMAWLLVGLAAAYGVAVGVRSGYRAWSGLDPARRRAARVLRQASEAMSEATTKAKGRDARGSSAARGRAMQLYLEGRFGVSPGSMTMAELEAALVASGVSSELAAAVREELESADFGRFAPAGEEGEECLSAVERAEAILAELRRVRPRSKA